MASDSVRVWGYDCPVAIEITLNDERGLIKQMGRVLECPLCLQNMSEHWIKDHLLAHKTKRLPSHGQQEIGFD